MKKLSLILVALIAAGVLLTGCSLFPAPVQATPEPTAEATEAPAATDGALEFSLTTLTDDTLDQSVFTDNKLVMVNYWATWCGPCVAEIPDLIKISKNYADKGFVIVGVLTGDDDIDGAKQFIADQGLSYPVVLPEDIFFDYSSDIYAIPTTKFFDSTGKQIGETVVGSMSYDDWAGLIDLLLTQVS
jgi:thiol-disulfide isomerase/thioredoxin